MSRLVTVVDATSGAGADVRLDCGGLLADVLPELARLLATTSLTASRDGRPLDPRQPVAHLHDGDVLVLGEPPTAAREQRVVVLEVTAGPDAGRRIALAAGRHVLGRAGDIHIAADPLLSRRHVELCVTVAGDVTLTDLDSSNGSRLVTATGPSPVAPGTPWPAGTPLVLGDTRLVHGRVDAPAATRPGPDGTTTINRAPRLRPAGEVVTIEFPSPPTPATTNRLPLLASLAPLLAGVVLAVVMHRWEFLAFAAMSPLMVLGQAAADRWSSRRAYRRAAAEHARAITAAEARLEVTLADEVARRHADAPDVAALARAAEERTSLLWHRGRDADALILRLGIGEVSAGVHVTGSHTGPRLAGVPVTIDLTRHRMVGLCGAVGTTALARSLLLQATALVGPADLGATVLAPGRAADWGWSRWLPHAQVAFTDDQVRRRIDELQGCVTDRPRLVVVDGVTEVAAATALSALPSTSVVWVARSDADLPAACTVVVTVTARPSVTLDVRAEDLSHEDVVADLVPVDVADRAGRAMATLRDGGCASSLPRVVPWSQLYDIPLGSVATTEAALARRWAAGPSTAVCLGLAAEGPLVIDLAVDGPHLLVAGTTGSGKSELLQSLVASLVAANSPADLTLLLVDFKGGAAFGPCASLPHTVGVLTDLDVSTTTRAIESLTAELRRRERLLAAAGLPDITEWQRRRVGRSGDDGLPRLVIVVDEFATLAEELPDFVGGLVGIAQRGRSLGVHLVLATQRPEGAVSADIRANTRLRICLAVAREAESRDVLDSPRAVAISRSTPGRALVRVGPHELVEVQTARVASPAAAEGVSTRLELVPLHTWGQARASEPAAGSPTELDLLVQAAVRAGRMVAARPAVPPWLPPLPTDLALSSLPRCTDGVAVGLADRPDEQAQPPLRVRTDTAESWLVVGAPRSGRSTAAVTIATALAASEPPDKLHMWALDGGCALGELSDLPHTGAVVDLRDVERVERLLGHLVAEVERRRSSAHCTEPHLLLVVDGQVDAERCHDLLLRLLLQGPGAGLRIVITGDRSALTGRLAGAVSTKICLRLADPTDYSLIGLPLRKVAGAMPAGRGIRSDDLTTVQLAVADAVTRATARAWPRPAFPPQRFEPLPTRVALHALAPASRGVIVGLRGDDLAPAVLDPDDVGGVLLVAGPARSGRSTALVSLAAQLQDRPVVALCARRGPMLQRRDLATVVDPHDADAARSALAALVPGSTLLVDDIDLVDDQVVLDGIEAAVRGARDGRGFVVLTGTTDAMSASFRGPVAQARRGGAGLLLRPESPHDGELLGVRLPRRTAHSDPPGRGILALHGSVVPVQVPDPT